MPQLPLKNLFLNSLLVILVASCAPTSNYKLTGSSLITENQVKPIINTNKALLYKAKLDLYRQHYSGLLLLKQTDANTSHLTFVTEIGMKMFDFEIKNDRFNLVYVFEPLNKPKLIQLLEADMKLILLQHLLKKEASIYKQKDQLIFKVKDGHRYYYELNPGKKTVKKIKVKGHILTKEKVLYNYNDSLDAEHIQLKHKGLIRLKIELTRLNKSLN